ncbi:hypothetical protein ACWAT4_28425 [Bradyrhizobium manausense]
MLSRDSNRLKLEVGKFLNSVAPPERKRKQADCDFGVIGGQRFDKHMKGRPKPGDRTLT